MNIDESIDKIKIFDSPELAQVK